MCVSVDGNDLNYYLSATTCSVSGVEAIPTSDGDDGASSDMTGMWAYDLLFLYTSYAYIHISLRCRVVNGAIGYETDSFQGNRCISNVRVGGKFIRESNTQAG